MGRTSSSTKVRVQSFGFQVGRGRQNRMEAADQHNEIELNFVNRGKVVFRHGINLCTIPQGSGVVYWAAVPHQVTATEPQTDVFWLVFPLSWFLSWNLAPAFTRRLLQGKIVPLPRDMAESPAPARLASWTRDFASRSPELRKVVQLELEAFFRRLALQPREKSGFPASLRLSRERQPCDRVQHMVRFMTEHAGEPITVSQIAAEAGLNPEYAMRLFRRHWGMTLWDFLLQQRISQAKRLLVLGHAKISDLAFECGFGSMSRFYSAFSKYCHCSPLAFRRQCGR